MTISELISKLEEARQTLGDVKVHTYGGTIDYVEADAGDSGCDPHCWIQ